MFLIETPGADFLLVHIASDETKKEKNKIKHNKSTKFEQIEQILISLNLHFGFWAVDKRNVPLLRSAISVM